MSKGRGTKRTAAPVVVVGVPVVDMVAYVRQFPSPGGHSPGTSLSVMPGGPAVNVATGVARLGHAALLLGKVGGDALGDLLRREMVQDGVEIPPSFVAQGYATATVLVLYDQDGGGEMRSFSFRQKTADVQLTTDDISPLLLKDARALFLDGILALDETLTKVGEHAATLAAQQRMRIFCDPNLRVPGDRLDVQMGARVERLFALSDEVLLNEQEARMLLDCWGEGEAADGDIVTKGRALAQKFPSVTCWVIKQGAKGAGVLADGDFFVQPAFSVQVSDTSGAGDSFDGAWISAYLEGLDRLEAAYRAAAVAALTVSGKGAWASLPDRQRVEQFLTSARLKK